MIPLSRGVAPFGHPWITACSRLPRASRSVPRPSSPPSAKASTRCPSRARPNPLARTPRTAPKRAAQDTPASRPKPSLSSARRLPSCSLCLYTHSYTHSTLLTRTAQLHPEGCWSDTSPAARPTSAPTPIHTAKTTPTPRADAPLTQEARATQQGALNPRRNAPAPKAPSSPEDEQPGDDRDRTGDPLLAKQVLSQLSYVPFGKFPALSGQRSVASAQRPGSRQTSLASLPSLNTANCSCELAPASCSWAREDLNLRPHAYQACALTN